eukprot:CAMPEP_0116870690 /NCGR_PEP_ID=MMETSP0463-20121206/704_1 /TAXON_ID=181622 /ORGANISM="Strombidinopsis sp, Strain SopsisLIS2011" /LENGTH=116 /DNA_ID=CAMNT_0004507691 /DNA_START=1152 /DNA_END=1502 /DNA_ORIENTATION=-
MRHSLNFSLVIPNFRKDLFESHINLVKLLKGREQETNETSLDLVRAMHDWIEDMIEFKVFENAKNYLIESRISLDKISDLNERTLAAYNHQINLGNKLDCLKAVAAQAKKPTKAEI